MGVRVLVFLFATTGALQCYTGHFRDFDRAAVAACAEEKQCCRHEHRQDGSVKAACAPCRDELVGPGLRYDFSKGLCYGLKKTDGDSTVVCLCTGVACKTDLKWTPTIGGPLDESHRPMIWGSEAVAEKKNAGFICAASAASDLGYSMSGFIRCRFGCSLMLPRESVYNRKAGHDGFIDSKGVTEGCLQDGDRMSYFKRVLSSYGNLTFTCIQKAVEWYNEEYKGKEYPPPKEVQTGLQATLTHDMSHCWCQESGCTLQSADPRDVQAFRDATPIYPDDTKNHQTHVNDDPSVVKEPTEADHHSNHSTTSIVEETTEAGVRNSTTAEVILVEPTDTKHRSNHSATEVNATEKYDEHTSRSNHSTTEVNVTKKPSENTSRSNHSTTEVNVTERPPEKTSRSHHSTTEMSVTQEHDENTSRSNYEYEYGRTRQPNDGIMYETLATSTKTPNPFRDIPIRLDSDFWAGGAGSQKPSIILAILPLPLALLIR